MERVSKLPLSSLRVHQKWRDAPLGAILQMKLPDGIRTKLAGKTIIGMRTQLVTTNQTSNAIVVLGGEEAGILVTDHYLGDGVLSEAGPALDVESQVEIVALDPAPFNCNDGLPLPPGALLRRIEGEKTFFVWTRVVETDITAGGLCLRSDGQGFTVGKCSQFPTKEGVLLGLAKKIDLRLTEAKLVEIHRNETSLATPSE